MTKTVKAVASSHPTAPEVSKPFHKIQFGLVRGSIWKHEASDRISFTLTVDRIVQATETSEELTQTFQSADMRNLAKVTADCARWIQWQENIPGSRERR